MIKRLGSLLVVTISVVSFAVAGMPTVQAASSPEIIDSSPRDQERILFPYGAATTKRTLAFLFDQPIHAASSIDHTITVTNLDSTHTVVASKIELFSGMLYFTSNDFAFSDAGTHYRLVVHHDQILANSSNTPMAHDYAVNFLISSQSSSSPENSPSLRIEQGILTPQVIFDHNDSAATYKITVYNTGSYDLQSLNLTEVLPIGFSFDHIISGNFTVSPLNTSGNILGLHAGTLLQGNEASITFRVTILTDSSHAEVSPGVYSSSTLGYGTFIPTGLGTTRFTTPITSNYEDNREDDEDVTITHVSLPQITTAASSLSTQSGATTLTHPAHDPLTCLKINGATVLTLSDVNSLVAEKKFIDFLTTTTYVQNTLVRLAKGYADSSFGVNNTLTRFELTKMALGANCIDYTLAPVPNNFFNDVPKDQSEISLVIGKARSIGIINGIGDRFFPNNPVSYGEMVKILLGGGIYFSHGLPVSPQTSTLQGITDETFRQFAEYASQMNLVNIDTDRNFPQNDPVIRRYMAQAVARYVIWLKNISPL